MKFSELTPDQWGELQPYLDTAVLPVTGLTGNEAPYQATEALEKLRDVLDLIEKPFKGRIVTYPTCNYGAWNTETAQQVASVCRNLKQTAGFKHVVVAAAFSEPSLMKTEEADLFVGPDSNGVLPAAEEVSVAVRHLWMGQRTS
ncbi:DUF2487 family protein [Paenibacillus nasutitermitis]|uniref:DUF2487 family protein n=1 Tax=Paenibacillus nasutitermitis TaxID=1652958 RepID=A0A916YZX6_9BACL|nr:DUF2487 family protein [Paenibacillus nasutitermitis]GGD69053.1 hypothetical protein GCM10010911_28590 [Paenibacillus nasutitermitis]